MTTDADRQAIEALLVRYVWAIDDKDLDALDDVFTPDAAIDYTSSGGIRGAYPEIKQWLARTLAAFPMTQHLLANVDVVVDGDTATARSAFSNPMGAATRAGPLHVFQIGGRYDDRLVRTADGWRIAERLETQLWMSGSLPPELLVPDEGVPSD